MKTRLHASNLLVLLYNQVFKRNTIGLLFFITLLSLVVPLVLAWASGVLQSSEHVKMSYLDDFVAWGGVGLGIPLIVLCTIRYLYTLRRALLLTFRRTIFSVQPNSQRQVVSHFVDGINSRWNLITFVFALLSNIIWLPYLASSPSTTWILQCDEGVCGLTIPGMYYMFLVTVTIYMYLSVAICGVRTAVFLWRLVRLGEVNVNPLHPDRSGGLAFLGELGIQNVYPIVIIGFNISLVALSDVVNLDKPFISPYHLILATSYVIVAFTVFFLPLSVFYRPMKKQKDNVLASLGKRSQQAYMQIQNANDTETFDAALKEIQRIEAMHKIAKEMPVWPFSFAIVRKFMIAILSPLLPAIIGQLVAQIFTGVG